VQTLLEPWCGYKPSLRILKVFGCLCSTKLSTPNLIADKKEIPGIFVGVAYSLKLPSLLPLKKEIDNGKGRICLYENEQ